MTIEVIGETEPPLSITPVLGYRTWTMTSEGVLTGCIYTEPWGRPAEAECMMRAKDKPPCSNIPDPDHMCGFYGWWTYEQLQKSQVAGSRKLVQVRGVVMGWGRTILATKGFRSRYARPLSLLRWPERRVKVREAFTPDMAADAAEWEEVLTTVAENYQVPLVDDPDELMPAAKEVMG